MVKSGTNTLKHGFRAMRERDPYWDINEFEDISKGVFYEVYSLWREQDLETLENLATEKGFDFFASTSKIWGKLDIEPFSKMFMHLDSFSLSGRVLA